MLLTVRKSLRTLLFALADTAVLLIKTLDLARMLFFDKVFKKKGCDAVERLSRCIEVVERYPGLCRLTMG